MLGKSNLLSTMENMTANVTACENIRKLLQLSNVEYLFYVRTLTNTSSTAQLLWIFIYKQNVEVLTAAFMHMAVIL